MRKDIGWAKRFLLLLFVPLYLVAIALFFIKYVIAILFMPKEAWRLAVSFDRLANAVFGGSMNETISARAGKSKEESLCACVLCKFLDLFDKDHCAKEAIKCRNK